MFQGPKLEGAVPCKDVLESGIYYCITNPLSKSPSRRIKVEICFKTVGYNPSFILIHTTVFCELSFLPSNEITKLAEMPGLSNTRNIQIHREFPTTSIWSEATTLPSQWTGDRLKKNTARVWGDGKPKWMGRWFESSKFIRVTVFSQFWGYFGGVTFGLVSW